MRTGFYYVYILRSEAEPFHFYTGFTEDLDARLKHHNSGGDPHTGSCRPSLRHVETGWKAANIWTHIRLTATLRHHGVTAFATRNTRDFVGLGFTRVWDPTATHAN